MSEENSDSDESDSSNEEAKVDPAAIPKISISGMTSEQNGFTE